MKKKIGITFCFIIIILGILGLITNYIDSGRVTTGYYPKYCIKIISNDGFKVTYWGLGYKVIRYVGVSPNEPFKNSLGVKMGSWFMKYELPEEKSIIVDYNSQKIEIKSSREVNSISNIIFNSKFLDAPCDGKITHKLIYDNETYYLKEGCQALQKNDKQAKLSEEDLNTILDAIKNNELDF